MKAPASRRQVGVVGSGPAGLMAAFELARAGFAPRVFEKRRSAGWKLLVAGSSGLNITYEAPLEEFARVYQGPPGRFARILEGFPPQAWRAFIERELGIPTFKGTSRRWFVEGMKAAGLLKAWLGRLEELGARFEYEAECTGLEALPQGGARLRFASGASRELEAVVFALGGGSWEKNEKPLRWPAIFESLGVGIEPFCASNVGFRVEWPPAFLKECEGKPVKNVVLRSPRGERAGDLVVTSYGLEGTPIYFAGLEGRVTLDLKPDLSEAQVVERLQGGREKLSPIRAAGRRLGLSEAAHALLFHLVPREAHRQAARLAALIKEFPLQLLERQPLEEAISSSGGVRWEELDEHGQLKRVPGVWLAGEMIDWDAPTGGFLLQACVSQGSLCGRAAARYLEDRDGKKR